MTNETGVGQDELADLLQRWLALSEPDRRAFLALTEQASAQPARKSARTHLQETGRILAVQTLGSVRERFLGR